MRLARIGYCYFHTVNSQSLIMKINMNRPQKTKFTKYIDQNLFQPCVLVIFLTTFLPINIEATVPVIIIIIWRSLTISVEAC